ncbi:MAG: patatin-like phospholipase family protein [Pseudomonadota bacterium]
MGMFSYMGLDISPTLKSIPFLKDAPARALRAAGREATLFSLPAGWTLFEKGEPANAIYFVMSGALGAFRHSMDGRLELLSIIRAGEPVGEMALFTGGPDTVNPPRSASVYALRDTEILKLSRAGFDRLIKADPEILQRLIRVILHRLRNENRRSSRGEPRVFSLVATSPTIDLELRAKALAQSLGRLGLNVKIVDEAEGDDKPTSFFDSCEREHDIVLLTSQVGDSSWFRLSIRQADRIWVLGRADARPSTPLLPRAHSPALELKLVDVVLLSHGGDRRRGRPDDWLTAAGAGRLFHWNGVENGDCDRLARIMAGRSVGLVFSGGGARAYAHIGVVRALREYGVPIDFAGGSSMGAVIAACVAMGWSDDEIDTRIRKAFVESNPLGDYTLPVVGMVKGRRVNTRLKEHFGETEIGELTLPFFAVSTNLTSGAFHVHRTGKVRDALRATISLPGILPPVVQDGSVLVDGAVLNNFPTDVMQGLHRGFTVGCDVARAPEGLDAKEFIDPPSFTEWVLQHGFGAAPPIASLLMRSATLSVNPTEGRDLADLLVLPELADVELRDWEAYDAAVEAGYETAKLALANATPIRALAAPALEAQAG